ncbi:MAG: NTP transferase domain-containing protein [Verrucomicrobia bacterium]|nr:NTP transferase domain-containing protein [Verrucomicrobiota bacterium]
MTKVNSNYVVIMAGGRGERFWPMSREATPKQLISILGNRSFLQEAVDRVVPIVPAENIFIITNIAQVQEVRRQLPELPGDNIVAEPCGRDTCAAVALGAALVGQKDPQGVMAVLPADHVIPDAGNFQRVLQDALDFAAHGNHIVTIGIHPNEPATGYGYIHCGEKISHPSGARPTAFYKGKRFVEKPDLPTAESYLASGEYRWNAGMFIWSYPTVLEALQQHQPDMANLCQKWAQSPSLSSMLALLEVDYPPITKISVDFAIMEKVSNVVVADGAFIWDDLGAWTALARHLPLDPDGNATKAQFLHVDSSNNIIFDGRSPDRRSPITLVGIHNCIVVQTNDATLVASKAESQKIKNLVRMLGENPDFKHLA